MNFGSERELRSQLGAALDLLDPGPLPLEAVVRRGATVLIVRKALALVVLAGAALTVPKLAEHLAHPLPAAPLYHVTVNPPAKGSNHLIASGTVKNGLNNMHWSVSGVGSGRHFHLHWYSSG